MGHGDSVGYVLISAESGKEHEVSDAMGRIDEVVEYHPLFGEYDFIAKIGPKKEGDAIPNLGNVVCDKIRIIKGVKDTKTLPTVNFNQ